MWLIITAIALLITVVVTQHIVIIILKDKRYVPSGGLVDKPNFNYIKMDRVFRPESLAKPKKERGGKIPPDKGLYNEAIKIDPKDYLEKYKKRRVNEMINKATEKPKEVEYIEFKGYKNFKEVADFVGYHFSKFVLKVNRCGEELIETDNGTFQTGVIFYRYLDTDTEEYIYDVMSNDKFFRFYKEEVSE
ncbi:hypothetical protein [Staphylococcus delphini]|uniref:hypothetical protein n=1 Tax=Staphylococcus delphini TaxID=53344 RepID=UPI0012D356E4|nr:hypothetical protein [Staphylococcus delphini]MTV20660.1 hypothetical protein [Staphylococcus delphini]